MWKKVDAYVKKYQMIEEGDSIVTGLSGGGDSVCLLRYLLSVRERMDIKIYAVHVNHLLRQGEAQRDQEFAENLCAQWNIPCFSITKDVAKVRKEKGCSLEEAGRIVRYDCFEQAAVKWGCNKIAVAHHKNDLAETMLFRMARGTGIRGLAGIRPVNGNVIRPLLCLEKKEILDLLKKLEQSCVEDSTNGETEYSRNYIRLRILPEMEAVNSGAVAHLGKMAEEAAALSDYLENIFRERYRTYVCRKTEGCFLAVESFFSLHQIEQKEILRRMIIEMAGGQKDIAAVHVEQMLELAVKCEGKRIELPYGLIAGRVPGGLLLYNREHSAAIKKKGINDNENNKDEGYCQPVDFSQLEKTGNWEIDIDGRYHLSFCLKAFREGNIEKSDCVKYFDYDKIKSTLCIRIRQSGDYFVVDKEGRHKTLRRYFIDEKIPAAERNKKILLADGSHVLWVVGGRISENYKIHSETKRTLVVRAEEF